MTHTKNTFFNLIKYSKISNAKIEGINRNDWPDFCDAYFVEADYNGTPMTMDEIEMLNTEYPQHVNQYIHENELYF